MWNKGENVLKLTFCPCLYVYSASGKTEKVS